MPIPDGAPFLAGAPRGKHGPRRRLPFVLLLLGFPVARREQVEDVDPQDKTGRLQPLEALRVDHSEDRLAMFLPPLLRVADDRPVGPRRLGHGQPEDGVHRGPEAAPTVPAEDELVQVRVEVLLAEPMERAVSPPLHEREDAVDALEGDMRGQLVLPAEIAGLPVPSRNAGVRLVLVGVEDRPRSGVRQDEAVDVRLVDLR